MSRVCTYFPFCGILCHTCSTMSGESHWSRYRRKQGPWLISQHSLLRCSVVHPAESWTCIMCMFPIYLIHGGKSLQNQSWKPWRKTNLLLVWKKLLYPGEETTRFFFFFISDSILDWMFGACVRCLVTHLSSHVRSLCIYSQLLNIFIYTFSSSYKKWQEVISFVHWFSINSWE